VTAAIILALYATGCEATPTEPEAIPETPTAVLELPDEVANAIRLRAAWGLRADEAWVRRLAADPSAVANAKAWEIPVTNAERAELDARKHSSDAVRGVILRYGQDQLEWAGMFIDQEAGGVVVALFTDRVPEHTRELKKRLAPWLRWDVREARWTEGQLAMFSQQVAADEPWYRSIDAWFDGTGVDISGNAVLLRISSANRAAVRLVHEHFGNPAWLRVESDGIGRWVGARGILVVTAARTDGRPAVNLACVPTPDVPSAWIQGDVGFGTNDLGICRIEGIAATTWTVELKRDATGAADWVVVGRGRIVVPANGEGRIRIVVDE
jgi:hypothetical protein